MSAGTAARSIAIVPEEVEETMMFEERTRGSILRSAMIGAVILTAGCVDRANDGPGSEPGAAIPTTPCATGDTVVESPEVFQVRAEGLWDGRPSLGGIWVAHPDVDMPERVVIRNVGTGAATTGALFRREREIPGPVLQISSDAAEELGMLAGAPATLDVTALRPAEGAETATEAADGEDTVTDPADGGDAG